MLMMIKIRLWYIAVNVHENALKFLFVGYERSCLPIFSCAPHDVTGNSCTESRETTASINVHFLLLVDGQLLLSALHYEIILEV